MERESKKEARGERERRITTVVVSVATVPILRAAGTGICTRAGRGACACRRRGKRR